MTVSGYVKEGITITINTRRLSDDDASKLMERLPLNKIKKSCEETGQCLTVWVDGLSAHLRKTKRGYIVDLMKDDYYG